MQISTSCKKNCHFSLCRVPAFHKNTFNPPCAASFLRQIVRALEGNLPVDDLIGGVRPGHSAIQEPFGSSDYDTTQYKEDLEKFRKMALETQTHNSSECSGPTSEFGPPPSGSSSEGLRTTQDTQSGTEIRRGTTTNPDVREIEIQES